MAHPDNRRALQEVQAHPKDWLVIAGEFAESLDDLRYVLETLGPR